MSKRPVVRLTRSPYTEVEEIVIGAVGYGWRRAHKHVDTPSEEAILDAIVHAVMCDLGGAADFTWSRRADRS
jgi:hypothetical protein